MVGVQVRLLGVGAIDISVGDSFHIHVDAFNSLNPPPELCSQDIILFTHADEDHFSVDPLLSEYQGNVVVGPPSIAFPLLKTGKISPERLVIEYPGLPPNP